MSCRRHVWREGLLKIQGWWRRLTFFSRFPAQHCLGKGWEEVILSYCWWFRNPANQLRLVVYPNICSFFKHPRWLFGISEPSTVLCRNGPIPVHFPIQLDPFSLNAQQVGCRPHSLKKWCPNDASDVDFPNSTPKTGLAFGTGELHEIQTSPSELWRTCALQALLEKTRRSATVRAVTKVEVASTCCLGLGGGRCMSIKACSAWMAFTKDKFSMQNDILLLWVKWQQVEEIALCRKCNQRW